MSNNDIIGISILIISYAVTIILFFRSLKIVKLIEKENLNHLEDIRKRLAVGKSEAEKNKETT